MLTRRSLLLHATAIAGSVVPYQICQAQPGGSEIRRTVPNEYNLLWSIPPALHGDIQARTSTVDVTAYVNEALASGAPVYAPPGLYVIAATTPGIARIRGAGRGATIFQLSSAIGAGQHMFSTAGSLGAPVMLTADAAAGATRIQVSDTASLGAGDLLVLSDGHSYNPLDSNYKSGETVRVRSVDRGTVLTLYSRIAGSWHGSAAYQMANRAKINKITPAGACYLRDLTIQGLWDKADFLVYWGYVLGGQVDNVEFKDHGDGALRLDGCIDTTVTDSSFDNLRDEPGLGFVGYGIDLSGPCDNIGIYGCAFSRCRHGVTTGGNTPYGMAHRVNIIGCLGLDTSQAPIDMHAAGDGFLIANCQLYHSGGNGITIRGRNVMAEGNLIQAPRVHGIAIAETLAADVTVRGNRVVRAGAGVNATHGIYARTAYPQLRVMFNEVIDSGGDGIHLFSGGTTDGANLVVLMNYIRGFGLRQPNRHGILQTQLSGRSTGAYIGRNVIDPGSGSAAYAIRTQALTGTASDNTALGTYGTAAFDFGMLTWLDAEGSYTPTLTNGANVAASTAVLCYYTRRNNIVRVFGGFRLDPAAGGGTATSLGISLPIASALTSDEQLSGTGMGDTNEPCRITGDAANDRAELDFLAQNDANHGFKFQFEYLVV